MARDDDSYSSSSGSRMDSRKIIKAIVVIAVIIGGVFMFSFLSSQKGQVWAQERGQWMSQKINQGVSVIQDKLTFNQNLFVTKTNPESTEKGLILKKFSVAGVDRIPPNGQPVFLYEVEAKNIDELDISNINIGLNCSVKDKEGVENNYVKDGEKGIILSPAKTTTYSPGDRYQCRFLTEPPEEEAVLNVYGSIVFDFETKDATLKAYFTKNKDSKFLSELGVSDPTGVVYNGEPVKISMGIGNSAQAAVVVDENSDEESFNDLTITLRNQWSGVLTKLNSMELKLPACVEINKVQSPKTLACPFDDKGSANSFNVYEADTEYLSYVTNIAAYKDVSFSCFLSIDASCLNLDREAYTQRNIIVSSGYSYQSQPLMESITLLPSKEKFDGTTTEVTQQTMDQKKGATQ